MDPMVELWEGLISDLSAGKEKLAQICELDPKNNWAGIVMRDQVNQLLGLAKEQLRRISRGGDLSHEAVVSAMAAPGNDIAHYERRPIIVKLPE